MFGTIRKHQNWLWLVIIVFTIVAFVIFFTPGGQNPLAGGRGANYGLVNGKVIDEGRFRDAQREVVLRFRFAYGTWPNDQLMEMRNFNLQRETYSRILLDEKVKELGIKVSDKTAADVARAMLSQAGMSYQNFVDSLKANPVMGITAKDFDRFVRSEAAITQLVSMIGLSGRLLTDKEVDEFYRFENQQIAAHAVFFDLSNHLDQVQIDEAAVGTFFTNRMASYRIPERVQVRYVRFDLTNNLEKADEVLGKMTNVNQIVEAMFASNRTNYFNRGAKTEEEAQAMIREDLRKEFAMREARSKAVAFDDFLIEQEPENISDFDKRAQEEGLTIHTTTPFTRDYGPQDMDVPPEFANVAFELTSEKPFGDLVQDADAYFVLGFDKRFPSEVPSFSDVRERVIADYRRSQALSAAQQEGSQFLATLTNGLASGKSFEEICSANQKVPVSLPLFSARTSSLPEVEDNVRLDLLKDVAFRTPPGEASSFIPTSTGGMILYVDSRQPVDEDKMRTELPDFAKYVRRARQNNLYQGWLQQQFAMGYLKIPQSAMSQDATQ